MRLLAEAGLTAYRFSLEWARIEPVEAEFSRAALQHYRRMIETARELGLEPVVTLHHFTSPQWFAARGGWRADDAVDLFPRYVERASDILDGVRWVVTINEPNMLAPMARMAETMADGGGDAGSSRRLPDPDEEIGRILVQGHRRARDIVRERTAALEALDAAVADGVDVRGYLHWSALDNYEWGSWRPTFGLIAVDRETFERHPKPSLAWLGRVARSGGDRDRASGSGDRRDDDADGAA